MKIAGYIRVSHERQVKNGYGLDAQENDIKRFAEYKQWELVDLYREEGVSGYKRDRPALERLLADSKSGKFDQVVFPSIDRTGRSVKDIIEIDIALRESGVNIVFLREGIDTSTATGQLFRNIMASIAEFEGRMICERLMKGRQRKAAAGGYVGGGIPYGCRLGEDGEIEVAPREAEIVKRIFRWAARGVSQRKIAKRLNRAGVPTRKGGPWWPSTIYNMLRNKSYLRKGIL